MSLFAAFDRKQIITLAVAAIATIAAGFMDLTHGNEVLAFITAAVALAALAATVGEATEHLGGHLSAGATGVLQSAIGNLPELFVSIFALRAGLVTVVQSSIVGSVLANSLLVLGLAFVLGSRRHGVLKFDSIPPRMIATLTMLAVSALVIPTLAFELHLPAGGHEDALGIFTAIILIVVFVASVPSIVKGGPEAVPAEAHVKARHWPLALTIGVLVVAGIGAAFVSEWFVAALEPTMDALNISEAFAGLVIVAIAGNAVENVVGVQLALRNKADLAVSVVLNSSLQVLLVLTPALVLLSWFVAGSVFTLVMPPLLVVALFLGALLGAVIVFDGHADGVEGVALVGLYAIIAAAFWWG